MTPKSGRRSRRSLVTSPSDGWPTDRLHQDRIGPRRRRSTRESRPEPHAGADALRTRRWATTGPPSGKRGRAWYALLQPLQRPARLSRAASRPGVRRSRVARRHRHPPAWQRLRRAGRLRQPARLGDPGARAMSTRARRMVPDERRAVILRAAGDLFSQRSYADVSVADIAAAAGVSPPLIVFHFGRKRSLYLAVLAAAAAAIRAGLDDLPGPPSLDRLRAGVRFYAGYARTHGPGSCRCCAAARTWPRRLAWSRRSGMSWRRRSTPRSARARAVRRPGHAHAAGGPGLPGVCRRRDRALARAARGPAGPGQRGHDRRRRGRGLRRGPGRQVATPGLRRDLAAG